MALSENINVFARVRPASPRFAEAAPSCVQTDPTTSTITIDNKGKKQQFQLKKVFRQNSTQENVFDDVGRAILDGFIDGINGTIFAYGQTGSGKTFTMLGVEGSHECDLLNRGIIPRMVEDIFATLQTRHEKNPDSFKFILKCSFLELYNEKLYDLLLFKKDASITIQQQRQKIVINGATECEVKTSEECMKCLWKGWNQRKVAETSMNHASSRSHAIFMLTLITETVDGTVLNRQTSRLNMVDLAGSERQTHTNNVGSKLREAGSINKSLSILARVIRDLASSRTSSTSSSTPQHISYRDSLLTFLLRDSLGGNARTAVIVNIHPNLQFVTDTLSTLSFAESVQKVRNVTTINSTLTYFQKVCNTLDETHKKNQKLQEKAENNRRNALAYLLRVQQSCLNTSTSDVEQ
uniref:Kinesin-like protein n=1 Tax=Panagrolaimus superbus TaxID=310955 RepID=A0A914YWE7_9BILA